MCVNVCNPAQAASIASVVIVGLGSTIQTSCGVCSTTPALAG